MRLLWFNLATDLDDPVLGFTSSWIREVATLVDSIDVITMCLGRVKPAENVRIYSVGKEKGFSEPRRVLEFYRHLFRILHREPIDACFSHMIPIFSVLASVPLKLRGIPLISWYAHRHESFTLKLAHHLSDRTVSINQSSYPKQSNKTTFLGHGIDTKLFTPSTQFHTTDPPLILFVGRLSPIKDPLTLLRAAHLLSNRNRFQIAVIGQILESDREYSKIVIEEIDQLRKTVPVEFIPGIGQNQLVSWYQRCFALVHCSPSDNALDKTVLEAMACGKPALSSTLCFKETMGQEASRLLFQAGDANELGSKLTSLLSLSRERVETLGDYLHQRTIQMHSLSRLTRQLTSLFHQRT